MPWTKHFHQSSNRPNSIQLSADDFGACYCGASVYYKVYPQVISVVGVIHGHRHPRSWLRRA